MRLWHEDSLDDCDYGWLKRVAKRLGKTDAIKEVKPSTNILMHNSAYNEDNLVSITKKEEVEI